MADDRLSFQLYSARLEPSLEDTFALLAKLGYRHVEPHGGLLRNQTTELEALMSKHGMSAPTTHLGLDWLREDRKAAIAACHHLGIATVFAPAPPMGERDKDEAGWRALGQELAAIGASLKDEGLRFGWHNHHWEFGKTAAGDSFLSAIFEEAPALLWQADLAWIIRGDADPLAEIERHGSRLVACHMKDLAPPGECLDEDGWADLGRGTMDWPALAAAMRRQGDVLFVAEHDRPKDAARFARQAIAAYSALV
jgi:sugar phosphate isomerase/epimerase